MRYLSSQRALELGKRGEMLFMYRVEQDSANAYFSGVAKTKFKTAGFRHCRLVGWDIDGQPWLNHLKWLDFHDCLFINCSFKSLAQPNGRNINFNSCKANPLRFHQCKLDNACLYFHVDGVLSLNECSIQGARLSLPAVTRFNQTVRHSNGVSKPILIQRGLLSGFLFQPESYKYFGYRTPGGEAYFEIGCQTEPRTTAQWREQKTRLLDKMGLTSYGDSLELSLQLIEQLNLECDLA